MADDTQSRGKDFIIKHMNADHQRSLSLYLQVYCSVSSRASQPPKLEDIRLTDLVISAQGTRYTIPFHPPLNSLAETRGRVVAMHKECLQRLGLSDIVIKEYRGPRGVQLAVFTCCLAAYVVYARRANFLPGSLFYEMAGLRRFPGVAGLNYHPWVTGGDEVEKAWGAPVFGVVVGLGVEWVPTKIGQIRQAKDTHGIHDRRRQALNSSTTQRRPLRCVPGEGLQDSETANMGISRDSRHKRSATGAKRATYRKKRAFEKGRQPSNTRIGTKRIHLVRTRGGNQKFRALRLDSGNFSWGSEGVSRKTRVIVVAYHPSNNELVRTNTLTKSAVVQIDAAPFRQWYEAHYGQPIGRRRQQKTETTEVKKSNSVVKKQAARFAESGKVESAIERQFESGRLYAVVASRPGQSGRVDGYILEGDELAFYQRAIRK
ncbi:hypothetical protein AOCH_001859 [Aspergillus ochraceoroseus]|uniref:40S ribosomal protein S8 n=1 Tax=Aspergillus ochraceoroseus TaxID=138278 RepID=A0A0F8UQS5_9EURO|nr:hypothetical protein AOCH_001859 [Aspergillus ochraceoroseus]